MVTFNEKYFMEAYIDYGRQNPSRKIAWYCTIVKRFITGKDPVSLLDIGCGYGYFLATMPASWNKYGIDPAHDLLRKIGMRCRGTAFAGGSVEAVPFSGRFDVVTAFDVLEHTHSLDNAGYSLASVLAPGGIVLFVVPVVDGPAGLAVRMLDKDPTHIHLQSRHEWLRWAQTHFDLLWWCGIMRGLIVKRYYLHIPTMYLRHFTPAIAVVARKKRG